MDFNRVLQVGLERRGHLLRGRVVEEHHVALRVELKRTEIEIRRTDDGDEVIRDNRLLVENCRLIFEDANAIREQLAVKSVSGVSHDRDIALPRQ